MTSSDPSPTPDRIRALGLGFRQARVVSAVELGVFAVLAEGECDADALADRLGVHPRAARDFFDALVALGLLDRSDGVYANAEEAAAYLDPARPSYVGGGLRASTFLEWGRLTEALRTGQPQLGESEVGAERWDERYTTPAGVEVCTAFFTTLSREAMAVIARGFPWERYGTVVDVGTAAGDLPVQVALTHPHLTGGGFDLPQVAPAFNAYVSSFGLSTRLRFYPGDFFADPLPTADVLTMANVLHDWGREERRLLLAKAHRALPAGGALVVFERFIDDQRRSNLPALLMSLQMLLANARGGNFTAAECCTWLREAGFQETTEWISATTSRWRWRPSSRRRPRSGGYRDQGVARRAAGRT